MKTEFNQLPFTHQTAIVFCDRFGADQIAEFNQTADKLIWIETHVLDPLGLPGVTSDAGEAIANSVEDFLTATGNPAH